MFQRAFRRRGLGQRSHDEVGKIAQNHSRSIFTVRNS
jgi:hypothetical protein